VEGGIVTSEQAKYFATAVASAQTDFRRAVDELAQNARAALLPYFAEHRLTYMSGNGTWFIEDTKKRKKDGLNNFVEDDALPKEIRDTLMLEVAHGDHLGFYIRDIKRADWRD
jgi:hypothetical protein